MLIAIVGPFALTRNSLPSMTDRSPASGTVITALVFEAPATNSQFLITQSAAPMLISAVTTAVAAAKAILSTTQFAPVMSMMSTVPFGVIKGRFRRFPNPTNLTPATLMACEVVGEEVDPARTKTVSPAVAFVTRASFKVVGVSGDLPSRIVVPRSQYHTWGAAAVEVPSE